MNYDDVNRARKVCEDYITQFRRIEEIYKFARSLPDNMTLKMSGNELTLTLEETSDVINYLKSIHDKYLIELNKLDIQTIMNEELTKYKQENHREIDESKVDEARSKLHAVFKKHQEEYNNEGTD